MATVGILHPGSMGSSVGAAAAACGSRVLWCARGRSEETRGRAREDGLVATETLEELAAASDVIVSVCPPASALDVAERVARAGFRGLYVDANAVSPSTARAVGAAVAAGGAELVDGGIVGPPARAGRRTLFYLSGERAAEVARLFEGSALEPRIVGRHVGQASALKMAFAAWTKGSSALLIAVRALAEAEGVSEALLDAWAQLMPELAQRSEQAALSAAPKAWRWAGEMLEIGATFESAGLPGGFHRSAAELYARLEPFKVEPPTFEAILRALLAEQPGDPVR
jgi:3-hydroxyisobutyrate dehydrogenase-like beta-hydroxyacid dehydrogenase